MHLAPCAYAHTGNLCCLTHVSLMNFHLLPLFHICWFCVVRVLYSFYHLRFFPTATSLVKNLNRLQQNKIQIVYFWNRRRLLNPGKSANDHSSFNIRINRLTYTLLLLLDGVSYLKLYRLPRGTLSEVTSCKVGVIAAPSNADICYRLLLSPPQMGITNPSHSS
ncbi:hypothetical protein LXL04_038366 [Taraxacum kok-saghyz]